MYTKWGVVLFFPYQELLFKQLRSWLTTNVTLSFIQRQ